jgi:hypothetical protein
LQAKFVFIKKIHLATTTVMLVSVLVLVQMVQLFTVADIFESDRARSIASYLDLHYGDVRVAVLNQPDVFTLLENPRREVIFKLTGMPVIGKNPLRDFPLPEVVVVSSSPDDNFRNEAAEVLDREYRLATSSLGYDIFELFR